MTRRALFKRLAAVAAVATLAPALKAEAASVRNQSGDTLSGSLTLLQGYADGGYISDPHVMLSTGSGTATWGTAWEYGQEVIVPASHFKTVRRLDA